MMFTILFILSGAFLVLDIFLYVRREARWAVDRTRGNIDAVNGYGPFLVVCGFFRATFRLVLIWLGFIFVSAFFYVIILGNPTLEGLF